jgi:hypothetical protein
MAWLTGSVLQLDEVNDAGEELLQSLRVILGGPNEVLTLADGTKLQPKLTPEGRVAMRCIGTMNVGPMDLPAALRDRFPYRIPLLRPSSAMIEALPNDLQDAVGKAYDACGWTPENTEARPMLTYREAVAFALARDAGVDTHDSAVLVWQERADAVIDHVAACGGRITR